MVAKKSVPLEVVDDRVLILKSLGNDHRLLIVEHLLECWRLATRKAATKSKRSVPAKARTVSRDRKVKAELRFDGIPVGDLCRLLGNAKAGTVSQHLADLQRGRLIESHKCGTQRLYRVVEPDRTAEVLKLAAVLRTRLFGGKPSTFEDRLNALTAQRTAADLKRTKGLVGKTAVRGVVADQLSEMKERVKLELREEVRLAIKQEFAAFKKSNRGGRS